MSERINQIDAYLDGELERAESLELRAWINAAPANARLFADRALLQHEVRSILKRDRMQTVQSPRQVLQELIELEANAQAELVHIHTLPRQRFYGAKQFATLLAKPQVISAIAAVLILAASLFLIFQGGGDEPASDGPSHIAEQPDRPDESFQAVATLTSTHNATWAEGALARGSQLKADDRLTLTAGFAEITTNRGAIAILEAPATIELLDNDNALRLHTGKLVGLCHTESSKGFVVRTPHMDIIDLGTRFGVAVDTSDNVLAEVFEGRVAVKRIASSGVSQEPVELAAGESFAQSEMGQPIPRDRFTANEFVSLNHFAAGIRLSGQVRLASRGFLGREVADWPTGPDAVLIEELRNHWLNADIPLTVQKPGTYLRFEETIASTTVPARTVIRSYVVLFNPGSDRNRGPYTAEGEVTFDGEILGVTTNEDDWQAFIRSVNDQTRQALMTVPKGVAALEYEGQFPQVTAELADRIVIDDDRRTLGFKLSVTGKSEAVRVIVQEPVGAFSP